MFANNNILGFTAIAALVAGTALMAAVMLISSDPRALAAPPDFPGPGPGMDGSVPGGQPLRAMPEPGMMPPDSQGMPGEPPDNMAPPDGGFEHATVAHTGFTLHDSTRGKDLEVRAYYPEPPGGEPLPVIVFSHGLGGSREVGQELMEFWASYGFVVLCPTHEDSIKLRREAGESIDPTTMLLEFGTNDERRVSRVEDDSFILDSLADVEREVPLLAGKIDAEHAGIGGHSAGAMTSMLLAGTKNDLPSGGQHSFRDERFDCALVLSGQGVGGGGFEESSWSEVTIPLMVMTGSEDYAITNTDPERRCDPYTYAPAGGKYLLFFDGAVHSSFTGQAAALQRANNGEAELTLRQRVEQQVTQESMEALLAADQEAIFIAVREASLAFWEAYLKGDQRALDWLNSDKPTKHFTKALHYSYK